MGSVSLNFVKDSNVWDDLENAYLCHELAATKVELDTLAHHYEMMQ